jgi:cytochrome c oxidase assembly factor CtaG
VAACIQIGVHLLLWAATHVPWDWEPSVGIGCVALGVLYAWVTWRANPRWRVAFFALGDAALLLALVSPLDTLADRYLFSAHMIQHLLLIELAAPLLLLGLPAAVFERWLRRPALAAIERTLRQPWLAWIIGFGTLSLWHVPALYDATVRLEGLHVFEHLSFLVSATIFWWPVLSPIETSRIELGESVMYLFARMAGNLVLGSFVAAAPLGVYTAYLHAPAAPGPLHAISHLLDQHLGGFLMWVPTLVVDLSAAPLFAVLYFTTWRRPAATPEMRLDAASRQS